MSATEPLHAAVPTRATLWLLAAVAGAAALAVGVLLFARLGADHALLAAALGLLAVLTVCFFGARALGLGGCIVALVVTCALLLPKRITIPLTPGLWGGAWDFTILLSGCLFALLAAQFLARRRRLRATGMEVWLAALFAVAAVSLLVNINRFSDPDPAARALVWLFAPTAALPLVANIPLSRRRRGLLLTLIIVLGGVLLLMGVFTTFHWWWRRLGPIGSLVFSPIQGMLGRARSPLGSPNAMGLVFAMLTPVVLVRVLGHRSLGKRLLYAAVAVLFLAGVVFSLSRSAVAVAVLGLIFFAAINSRVLGRRLVTTVVVLVLAGLVITGGVTAYRSRLNFGRLVTLAARQGRQAASDRLRASSGEAALRIAQRHPLVGAGMGRHYPRDTSTAPIRVHGMVTARDPHSLYVMALAELGAVGLVIVLVIAAKPVRDFMRAFRTARDPEAKALLSAFATAAFMIALYGITSSSVAVGFRLAYFVWALIGLGYQLTFEAREPAREP